MDDGSDVQDQNLVDDQVTQALSDSGVAEAAPVNPPPVPAPVVEPAEAETAAAEATQIDQPTVSAPVVETPTEDVTPESADEISEAVPTITPVKPAVTPSATSGDDDELMSVKQKALEQLSPLVDHLDLPPDQKFDTYMEILRASDDKTLVQPAFDAAQLIDDEDKKAQALLDVVNEVNYLTQDHEAAD